MKSFTSFTGVVFTTLLLSSGLATAADPIFGANSLQIQTSTKLSNMTIVVSGPDGYYTKEHAEYGSPFIALSKKGNLQDGLYKWEMTGSTNERVRANPMGLNNGRGDRQPEFINKSTTESGTFQVLNGSIVAPDSIQEEQTETNRPNRSFLEFFDK
ncbi:hypothetical protein [Litorimonas sp.]|jgi:hypothetical protein|uniref:hypothetical protein n=1 Tax=Litorimonas sp. TaxID=1892381 RepID=UPI003A880188